MSHLYDGLTIIALLGIAGSIFKFGYEFRRDGARQRSDLYDKLRERFDGEEFDNIFTALDNYAEALPEQQAQEEQAIRDLTINDRGGFAAFIEHVALVTKSGLISYPLANYEFGFYAIRCWECAPFWDDLCDDAKQDDPYWALYREFVENLRPAAEALKNNPSGEIAKLRF
jgi:hypothetical protein